MKEITIDLGLVAIMTTVVVAHFIALVSPGPDFLLVVRSAVRNTKSKALGVAFGISAANGVYITLCIVGVGAVLATSYVVMMILKIVGGLFLVYVAFLAIRSKRSDYAFISEENAQEKPLEGNSFRKEFLIGFVSGISNPKNILFYLSLFSVVLTNEVGIWFKIGLGIWMTVLVFLWDAFIIYVLSQDKVRRIFSKVAFFVDKVAGSVLGLIGMKLLESAVFEEQRI